MLRRKTKKVEEENTRKERQFVGFQIGEELYGIDIYSVQEIDRMQAITKLPKSLPFVEGVINLRNRIIPVIDMARRFGQEPTQDSRQTRIIITRIAGEVVGLIVGHVTEVIQIEEKSIEPAPSMAFSVDHKYVEGVGHISEGLVILLNLELLLSVEEMSQLRSHTSP